MRSINTAIDLERNKEDELIAVSEQWHIICGKSARGRRRICFAASVRTKNEILLCDFRNHILVSVFNVEPTWPIHS
jgi:hypothetical protein